jgi:hypothetical protein
MEDILNNWGRLTLDAVETTSRMLAKGLNLPEEELAGRLFGGANKLAPNANDLRRCKRG